MGEAQTSERRSAQFTGLFSSTKPPHPPTPHTKTGCWFCSVKYPVFLRCWLTPPPGRPPHGGSGGFLLFARLEFGSWRTGPERGTKRTSVASNRRRGTRSHTHPHTHTKIHTHPHTAKAAAQEIKHGSKHLFYCGGSRLQLAQCKAERQTHLRFSVFLDLEV